MNNSHDLICDPPDNWKTVDSVAVKSDKQEQQAQAQPIPVKEFRSRHAMPQLDFRNAVAFELAAIPEVEAVFTSEYGKVFFVWTVVNERNQELYERLYEKERELIQANQAVQFDFTIMASRGHDPRVLVNDPSAKLAYARS